MYVVTFRRISFLRLEAWRFVTPVPSLLVEILLQCKSGRQRRLLRTGNGMLSRDREDRQEEYIRIDVRECLRAPAVRGAALNSIERRFERGSSTLRCNVLCLSLPASSSPYAPEYNPLRAPISFTR